MTWHTALFTTATIFALAMTGIASAQSSNGNRGDSGSDGGGAALENKRLVRSILLRQNDCPPSIACNTDSNYERPRYKPLSSGFDCDYLLERSPPGNPGFWQFQYRQCIRLKQ